ncbi:MAG: type II toxin-antitoxin system VapC family toxin [Actinomycetota bacterium]|jgi:predicted nucleic acid-binding protein|nr:type II toxin-antitoxin system VapC family toxin [Actinomycetota bacterium]
MIVLDTNVVSEYMRVDVKPTVLTWFHSLVDDELVTTAVTLAEVELGIEQLPAGRRQERFRAQARSAFDVLGHRVLAFDAVAAHAYPGVILTRRRAGRPVGELDAQIAAICVSRGASLATRNVKDFEGLDIKLINPWEPPA